MSIAVTVWVGLPLNLWIPSISLAWQIVPVVSLLVLFLFSSIALFLSPFLSVLWSVILFCFKFIMYCSRYWLCWLPLSGAGWCVETVVSSQRDQKHHCKGQLRMVESRIQDSTMVVGFLAQTLSSSLKDDEKFSGLSTRKRDDEWKIMVLYFISL